VCFNILLEITDSFIHYYSFGARVTTTVISSDVKKETSELLDSNHNNNRSLYRRGNPQRQSLSNLSNGVCPAVILPGKTRKFV